MQTDEKVIYFIARRWRNIDGVAFLSFVIPENGQKADVEEKVLQDYGLQLGDFFRVRNGDLKKTAFLTSNVVEDVAYVRNITSKLVHRQGTLLFQNKLFSDSISRQNLPTGDYNVTICLLPGEHELPDGQKIQFEAIEAVPFKDIHAPQPGSLPSSTETVTEVGNGTTTGKGFERKPVKQEKLRAVVLNASEKNGVRRHFLWILDKHEDAIFHSKTHILHKGHFFEGLFTQNNKRWSCSEYLNPIETPPLKGGVDGKGHVWFTVKLEKYQEAGINMRFASGKAKYFGEILDTESMLKNKETKGKTVKIQKKPIAENEFVWAIIEVL